MRESVEERFRRLLLLVPYVIKRPGVPVGEVCEKFGLTKPQLIADLNLLFMCGLPGYGPGDLIEAETDGKVVSIRMAEYFSRPMRLTAAEGISLLAGSKALDAAGDHNDALDRAMAKLQHALGEEVLERVSVELERPEHIASVRHALEKRQRLHLVYQSQSKDELSERDVDPWALFVAGPAGRWYLLGWCHRVRDERIFRLDRMRDVTLLDVKAEVPESVDFDKYRNVYVEGPDAVKVTLDLQPRAAAWVAEYYPLESSEDLGDKRRVVLSAGGTAWLERLLLRLGPDAEVVEPQWLRERVKKKAGDLAKRYSG